MFSKEYILRNFAYFTGKYLCQSLFFNKVACLSLEVYLKKETLAQVFSCEFCEIERLFLQISYRTPTLAASISTKSIYLPLYFCQLVQFVMQFRYAILLAV